MPRAHVAFGVIVAPWPSAFLLVVVAAFYGELGDVRITWDLAFVAGIIASSAVTLLLVIPLGLVLRRFGFGMPSAYGVAGAAVGCLPTLVLGLFIGDGALTGWLLAGLIAAIWAALPALTFWFFARFDPEGRWG
jgi:hypothetical protein